MFTVEARDELRDYVVAMARQDARIVGLAEVGSLSVGEGDRWSDLDLTFAVDDAVAVGEVIDDWTSTLGDRGGVALFDLVAAPFTYRVFMFPECLQLDLSFSPASEFRPTGPRFRPIFGEPGEMRPATPSGGADLGWAVMWARHARVCIERGRLRQAEHAIGSMRERALDFACRRRDLPAGYGRGLEQLPAEVYDRFALPPGLEPETLERALKQCVAALTVECVDAAGIDQETCDRLRDAVVGM